VNQNPQQTFSFLRRLSARSQGLAKQAFVARDTAFDLPTLSKQPVGKAPPKLSSVLAPRYLSKPISRVQLNDCRPNPKSLTAQAMIVLPVVTAVSKNTINRQQRCSLHNDRHKIRGILARALAGMCTHNQMRTGEQCNCQFWPNAMPKNGLVLASFKIPADMSCLQPCPIHRYFRRGFNQAMSTGKLDSASQQRFKAPFFRKRCSAF
jgi:hypothetical protein